MYEGLSTSEGKKGRIYGIYWSSSTSLSLAVIIISSRRV